MPGHCNPHAPYLWTQIFSTSNTRTGAQTAPRTSQTTASACSIAPHMLTQSLSTSCIGACSSRSPPAPHVLATCTTRSAFPVEPNCCHLDHVHQVPQLLVTNDDFAGYDTPLLVGRNMTVRGAWPEPERWPFVDLAYIYRKVGPIRAPGTVLNSHRARPSCTLATAHANAHA